MVEGFYRVTKLGSGPFARSGGLFSIASDDFDFGLTDLLTYFPEFSRIHDESPHVVAKAVRVQMSFEGEFGAHAIRQRVIDRFVELQQHFQRQLRTDLSALNQIVQTLLKSMTQGRVAVKLVTHCLVCREMFF